MIRRISNPEAAKPLFGGIADTVVWACMEGSMGQVFVDEGFTCAMAFLGDFACISGEPSEEMVRFRPTEKAYSIIPLTESWNELIETCLAGEVEKTIRYDMKKEDNSFDRGKLAQAIWNLPPGYEMKLIDEPLYKRCLQEEWSQDFVKQFSSYAHFEAMGLGVVILHEGQIVAGASSYSAHARGIDIEIDTLPEFRRQGLAYIAASRLILECLRKGLDPCWDAATEISRALAEKLGYTLDRPYVCYERKAAE